MSLIPFLAICAAGSVLGLLALPTRRLARLVGVVALAAAFVAALTIKPADSLAVGQVQLATSWYAGLFLSAATACCLMLCILGLVVGWPVRLAPAALATFGGLAVAFSATDPAVVFAAIGASAAPGILVVIGSRAAESDAPDAAVETRLLDVSLSELRTLGLIAAGSLIAAAAVLRPSWTESGSTTVFAVAYLALGVAVAVRYGAVPFHVPASRLSKRGTKLGLALPLVWIPSGLGVVALSWSASVFQMQGDWLDVAVASLQVVAVVTLILGAVGALLHDELEEIATYSIIQDAGFVLLALAARDGDASGSARLWLIVFITAKSALVGWVAVLSWTFGSSRLQDLRGWLRRAPILGVALVVIVVATLGWPGSAIYEARATLVDLGLPSELHFLGFVAILLAIAYYGRLLAVGLLPTSVRVGSAPGERPRWPVPMTAAPAAPAAVAEAAKPARTRAAATSRPTVARPIPTEEQAAAAFGLAAARARRTTRVSAAPARLATPPPPPPAPAGGSHLRVVAGKLARLPARLLGAAKRSPLTAFARQTRVAWRLNRTLETSLLVLAIAAVAVAIAFGGFGSSGAAGSGISLDAAVAPMPQLPNTGSDQPYGPSPTQRTGADSPAPSPTSSSSGSASSGPSGSASSGPSESSGPSASSSASASSSQLPSQITGD